MGDSLTAIRGGTKKPRTMQAGSSGEFQTDPWALGPLVPHLRRLADTGTIWEPACGQGQLVRRLQQIAPTIASDIAPLCPDALTLDFLNDRSIESVPGCRAIITNPPYNGKMKDAFLRQAFHHWEHRGIPFALLLPFTALEGQARQVMYRKHGIELIFLPRRVTFTTPNGTVGGAWFPVAWFCRGIRPEGPGIEFWLGLDYPREGLFEEGEEDE